MDKIIEESNDVEICRINEVRIAAIEKRMNGIDRDFRIATKEMQEVRIKLSGALSELRVWGAIVMASLIAMIGFVVYVLRLLIEEVIGAGVP